MNLGPILIPGSGILAAGIGLVAAVLIGFLLRLGPRKKKLPIIAVVAMVFSLSVLALRPQIQTQSSPSSGLLLTPGTTLEQLRSAVHSTSPPAHVFSLIGDQPWKSLYPNLSIIPDMAYLTHHFPNVTALDVLGYGIPAYGYPRRNRIKLTHHAAPIEPGISQIHWPGTLTLGYPLTIQGRVHGLGTNSQQLYLSGPGGRTDSTEITRENPQFTLRTMPKEIGRYEYELVFAEAGRTLVPGEIIPVHVAVGDLPQILILESQPRFETKHLKNWLAHSNIATAVRTKISKDRFRDEFVNLSGSDLSAITRPLLDDFDLLMVDTPTLDALKANERQALSLAIENGLGMLISFDAALLDHQEAGENTHPFLRFTFNETSEMEFSAIRPILSSAPDRVLSLVTAAPYDIKAGFGFDLLIHDTLGRLFAASYQRGAGRIGLTLVTNAFQWLLEKQPEDYRAYWAHMISALARKQRKDRWLLPDPLTLFPDQPATYRLISSEPQPAVLVTSESGSTSTIDMARDSTESDLWFGTFWPREPGWHSIASESGAEAWFYVFDAGKWETLQKHQTIRATHLRANYPVKTPQTAMPHSQQQTRDLLRWPFFLVFLLAISYLWVERKR